MKIPLLTTALFLSSLDGSAAFCAPQKQPSTTRTTSATTSLEAQKNSWIGPAATATVMGWALASQIAGASSSGIASNNNCYDYYPSVVSASQLQPQQLADDAITTTSSASSLFLAVEKLDFSLPSYDSIGKNAGGFGDGTEARLGLTDSLVDPGANEKAKQVEAMKKAEEARLARKEAERLAKVQRNEEQIRAAEAKREADQKRIAELFGG